jgi:Domain of Unknown Function (DUF928)
MLHYVRAERLTGTALLAFAVVVALGGATEARAQASTAQPQRVVYQPPDVGAPPTRTLAAARGSGQQPAVQVLAPEQTGLALEAQPQLVWYLAEPSSASIEIAVVDESGIEPLLEADLGEVKDPGYHVVNLADHGVRFEPGREYRWSVALVIDPEQRSADMVASATIALKPPGAELTAQLSAAPLLDRLQILARNGYWYDLIAELSEQISSNPVDRGLRELRASLLDQDHVRLEDLAAYDRQVANAQ